MAYTTATDDAADIRRQYKAHGWNSRQVSVRSEYFSGGSAINVTIKDGQIPVPLAKDIAEGKERIHRCEITGEILSGANRYVSVTLTKDAQDLKARRYVQAVEAAIDQLPPYPTSTLQSIGETGYCVGRGHHNGTFSLWGETRHIADYMQTAETVALELALAIERGDK